MSEHTRKFYDFVVQKIKDKTNLNILEFGVKKGVSTKIFLELLERNNGNLFSVDINNYSDLFKSKKWKFIQTRDDNFKYLEELLPKEFDAILLDSLHEANHVEKIIYFYFNYLKMGGLFFIDDISWLPYLEKKERSSFYSEINNRETFNRILNIYTNNHDIFDLEFSFISSGFASLKKKNNLHLRPIKKYKNRTFSIKNLFRNVKKIVKN